MGKVGFEPTYRYAKQIYDLPLLTAQPLTQKCPVLCTEPPLQSAPGGPKPGGLRRRSKPRTPGEKAIELYMAPALDPQAGRRFAADDRSPKAVQLASGDAAGGDLGRVASPSDR
jgi:hypothetical protein